MILLLDKGVGCLKVLLFIVPIISYYLIIKDFKKHYNLNDKMAKIFLIVSIPVYLLFAYRYSFSPTTLIYSIVLAALFSATAIDLEQMIIPDKIILLLLICGVLNLIINIHNYKMLLGGFLFATVFSFALCLISNGGVGGGDVKLISILGLLLGYYNVYILLFIAYLFATIIGLVRICFKKATMKSPTPFGPFIALGFVILSFL